MAYEISVDTVPASPLAAARGQCDHAGIPLMIRQLLDVVWPYIRANGIQNTGTNVVIYRPGDVPGQLALEAGVIVAGPFEGSERVFASATPGGRVARITHVGPYSEMPKTYAALDEWLHRTAQPHVGISWEVYGHWNDDPAKLTTEIFWQLAK